MQSAKWNHIVILGAAAMFSGVIAFAAGATLSCSCPGMPDAPFGFWEFLLFRYQPLVGVAGTIAAAFFAGWPVWKQLTLLEQDRARSQAVELRSLLEPLGVQARWIDSFLGSLKEMRTLLPGSEFDDFWFGLGRSQPDNTLGVFGNAAHNTEQLILELAKVNARLLPAECVSAVRQAAASLREAHKRAKPDLTAILASTKVQPGLRDPGLLRTQLASALEALAVAEPSVISARKALLCEIEPLQDALARATVTSAGLSRARA